MFKMGRSFSLALMALVIAIPTIAEAKDKGDVIVRLRGLAVAPDESGSAETLNGSIQIDNDYIPELDITYFFSENIAAELILGTSEHSVKLNGASVVNRDVDLGSVKLLPPTLSLQYHFLPKHTFSPYIGAGINYTMFYNEKSGGDAAVNSIHYDDSFGYAFQAGFDYMIDENWLINMDVKKLFLETDVTVGTAIGEVKANSVEIDPWIFGAGVGYRF